MLVEKTNARLADASRREDVALERPCRVKHTADQRVSALCFSTCVFWIRFRPGEGRWFGGIGFL